MNIDTLNAYCSRQPAVYYAWLRVGDTSISVLAALSFLARTARVALKC